MIERIAARMGIPKTGCRLDLAKVWEKPSRRSLCFLILMLLEVMKNYAQVSNSGNLSGLNGEILQASETVRRKPRILESCKFIRF